jgi:hypothetical protein
MPQRSLPQGVVFTLYVVLAPCSIELDEIVEGMVGPRVIAVHNFT